MKQYNYSQGNLMRLLAVAIVAIGFSAASEAAEFAFDHVHMRVPDPAAAAAWYGRYMGGSVKPDPGFVVDFGRTVLRFEKFASAQPTEGSVIDHLGFSFIDLPAKVNELKTAGVKVLMPVHDVRGLFPLAFVEDPWSGKIELVQDTALTGFHHVHLRGRDPKALLRWIASTFGGERIKFRDRIDTVREGEINIFALESPSATTGSDGHVIDHLGYSVSNLKETLAVLSDHGVLIRQPMQSKDPVSWAFVESPTGIKVELIQWK